MKFSDDIWQGLLDTGGGFPRVLEISHAKFCAGDRSSLMTILIACSLWGEAIPDWVADELLTLDGQIANLDIKDMNEFFAFKKTHGSKLRLSREIRLHESAVKSALFHHRINGGNFSSGDGIAAVSENLNLPRRLVEAIYIKNQSWLKTLPPKEQNPGYFLIESDSLLELARFRRQNRDE